MIHILMAFALKGKVLKVVIEKVIRRLLRNAKSHVMNQLANVCTVQWYIQDKI